MRNGENDEKIVLQKFLFTLTVFLAFVGIFSLLSSASETISADSKSFVGYSNGMSLESLQLQTNTSKDDSGNYTNPIDISAPQITFLLPGLGADASSWTNDSGYGGENNYCFAYNDNSLVEKLRDISNATVFYAKVTSTYEDNPNKGTVLETEGSLKTQQFELYAFPDMCVEEECDKECGKFHENLEKFEINDAQFFSNLPGNTRGHIIVLFDPIDSNGSNDKLFNQFDYVADKIIYDYKILHGGILPTINLIAHSRGGLIAMKYALRHPFLVDSMITVGTPFSGSFLGNIDVLLEAINLSGDLGEPNFSFGVKDVLDKDVYNDYMQTWNDGYDELYSHINFCAIAGVTTIGGISYILENDTHHTEMYSTYIGKVLKHVDVLSNFHSIPSTPGVPYPPGVPEPPALIFYEDFNYIIYDDLFIDAPSQLAILYKGVEQKIRYFEEDNIDLTMLSQKNTAIPHNLEPGDSEIHEYIINNLVFYQPSPDVFTYYKRPDNGVVITGLTKNYTGTTVIIPEIIDGLFVREIAPYAFANRTDIQAVVIPDYVTKVSHHAFFNCTGLTSVTSEFGFGIEVIEDYAFAGCTSLSTFEVPTCTREVGNYAFANTALISIHLGTLMEDFSPSACAGSAIQSFVVSENNMLFEVIDGVLYNAESTKIIAYPSGKTATSFTVPNTVTEISPYAFAGATNLTSVNLGNITVVPRAAFAGCISLESVIGTSVLLVAHDSFHNTEFINAQTTVTLGDVLLRYRGTATSETLDYYSIASFAFQDNETLTSVKFTNKLVSIDMLAFPGHALLTDFYFKGNSVVNLEDFAFGTDVDNRSFYVAEFLLDDYQAHTSWEDYKEELKVFFTTIQYDSQGGSSIPATEFSYYSQLTQENLPIPTRIGYAFVGWVLGEGDDQETLSVGDWWLSLDEEVTLTASWIPTVYSSEFDPCGGILSSNQIVHTENGVQLPIPTRNGYIFDGWYSEEDGAGMQFTEDDGILLLEWDQMQVPKLYAEWTPISYTITYVLNGGTNASANPTTYTIEDSITFAAPTRSGYRFAGWYTDSAFSIGVTTIQTTQGNITLYAKWQFLYTVTFEHNYSTITVQAISGEIITVPNFSSTDAPVYIYVSGATRLAGGASYEVNGNIAFKSEERLLSECYQIINNKGEYCIYTYNQFRGIEDITKNSSNKFMLMRDIDVSVTYSIHISDFYGEFDGNGKTLRYVREVVFPLDSYGGNYALFKRNYGTIKNCTINGLMIDIQTASDTSASTMYYAAFVAGTNYGTITGITVQNCEIIVNRQCVSVGTIAGYNYNGTISYCNANNITFTGYGDMGGIAGTSADGSISNCTASSITMTLSIDAVNRSAGGIVAYAYNGAYIANCSVTSLTLSFGGYKNIADTAVQPVMGFVVAYLQDSTATNISATGCSRSFGNLPEKTGTLFNRHYPRKYVCASNNGMIGYKNNSTVS